MTGFANSACFIVQSHCLVNLKIHKICYVGMTDRLDRIYRVTIPLLLVLRYYRKKTLLSAMIIDIEEIFNTEILLL